MSCIALVDIVLIQINVCGCGGSFEILSMHNILYMAKKYLKYGTTLKHMLNLYKTPSQLFLDQGKGKFILLGCRCCKSRVNTLVPYCLLQGCLSLHLVWLLVN